MTSFFEKEKTLEALLESLIRMLGKSNQRVDDLSKRVIQLELILQESVLKGKRGNKDLPNTDRTYTFTN